MEFVDDKSAFAVWREGNVGDLLDQDIKAARPPFALSG
jgi:hypothetical protein